MEPTGVYHEKLAYHLYERDCMISIVLPNRINAFAKTCVCKQQDDQQASKVLAEFGCVKKLDVWEPPHPVYSQLKQLTREKNQLQDEQTVVLNQLHAEKAKAISSKSTIRRMKARLRLLEKQITEIDNELKAVADADESLNNRIENVCTIPGVGVSTVITVIGETNGFHLIKNNRQLVSYAGYDVIEKKSGTSVRGRPHISKRGNSYIRKALYFPAFSAVKYNKPLTDLYGRIMERQDVKMKGYVAVQRKLLILIYTLWKKNEVYNPSIKFLEQPVEAALTELD
jgi:transposase